MSTDERLRAAGRDRLLTAEALRWRMRSGQITDQQLVLLAYCGRKEAVETLGLKHKPDSDPALIFEGGNVRLYIPWDHKAWFMGLIGWGQDVMLRSLLCAARYTCEALEAWDALNRAGGVAPLEAWEGLRLAEAWTQCPCQSCASQVEHYHGVLHQAGATTWMHVLGAVRCVANTEQLDAPMERGHRFRQECDAALSGLDTLRSLKLARAVTEGWLTKWVLR